MWYTRLLSCEACLLYVCVILPIVSKDSAGLNVITRP